MRVYKKGKIVPILALLVSGLVLSGCSSPSGSGNSSEPDATDAADSGQTQPGGTEEEAPFAANINLSLDWSTYVSYHAPFAIAQEEGIFAEYGLTVKETLPGGSGDTVVEVGTGKTDIGWADLSTSAAAILQEVPIQAVARVQAENASGLTVLAGTKFDSAADVKGMRIGSTPGGSDATLVGAFLKANGIQENEVEIVNLPANGKFAALMTGDVDAISGQVYFYVTSAQSEGKDAFGRSYTELGLEMLDHGFISNLDFIKNNPEAITRFIAAYKEGLARTIADPVNACTVLAAKSDGAVIQESCEAQLALWLPLADSPSDANWGVSSLDAWQTTVSALKEFGDSTGDADPASMFTNDLLP